MVESLVKLEVHEGANLLFNLKNERVKGLALSRILEQKGAQKDNAAALEVTLFGLFLICTELSNTANKLLAF